MTFAVISRSEVFSRPLPGLQRTHGAARVRFKWENGATRLDRLFQSGAAKIRFPNVAARQPVQAVLINSAGGLTGGDSMSIIAEAGTGARALLTTQACEKIYRSVGGDASVETALFVGEAARLDWLPQETILFDGARLRRRLEVDLEVGATLLAGEATLFGRAARGETVGSGLFADRWRVRRQGRLVFADDLRLDWADDAALLRRPAVVAGAGAMATILYVGAEPERHLTPLRSILGGAGGASAWNGKLLARFTAEGGADLRQVLIPALVELLDGAALPRIWQI